MLLLVLKAMVMRMRHRKQARLWATALFKWLTKYYLHD